MKAGTLWRLLQHLNVLLPPERVEAFIQTCECDAKGHLGLKERDYPQSDYLRAAMGLMRSIKASDFAADVKGPNIGEMLIQKPIQALARLNHQFA